VAQVIAIFCSVFLVSACVGFAVKKDVGEISSIGNGNFKFAINLPPNQTFWRLAFESPSGTSLPGNAVVTIVNKGSENVEVNHSIHQNVTLSPGKNLVVFSGPLSRLLNDSWGGVTINCHPVRGSLNLTLLVKLSGIEKNANRLAITARSADGK